MRALFPCLAPLLFVCTVAHGAEPYSVPAHMVCVSENQVVFGDRPSAVLADPTSQFTACDHLPRPDELTNVGISYHSEIVGRGKNRMVRKVLTGGGGANGPFSSLSQAPAFRGLNPRPGDVCVTDYVDDVRTKATCWSGHTRAPAAAPPKEAPRTASRPAAVQAPAAPEENLALPIEKKPSAPAPASGEPSPSILAPAFTPDFGRPAEEGEPILNPSQVPSEIKF